jgi:hypothetical protein
VILQNDQRAANGLPAGLSVNTSTGFISGAPLVAGVFNVTISASNGATGNAVLALTVQQPPAITDGPPPAANLNTAYGFTYTSSGYPAPIFSVTSGVLPTGLTLSSDGTISGTPTADGTYAGTVTASNEIGTATQNFSITVQSSPTLPLITNGLPPSPAAVNTPYTFSYSTSGYPAPTFSVSAGALPTGLTLASDGVISGTPIQTGTFGGTVTASNGPGSDATQDFTITITDATPAADTPTMPPWGLAALAALLMAAASKLWPDHRLARQPDCSENTSDVLRRAGQRNGSEAGGI